MKTAFKSENGNKSVSLLPHNSNLECLNNVFLKKGHSKDTLNIAISKMKAYTKPKLNTSIPNKWFIYYNYVVPPELSHLFKSKKHRFKVYKDINRITDLKEKTKYANELLDLLDTLLRTNQYNPFEAYIEKLKEIEYKKNLNRKDVLFSNALKLFIESRKENKVDPKTITTYNNTINWLTKFIEDKKVSDITRLEVSEALKQATNLYKWSNTTFNKQRGFAIVIFNWFEQDEYILKNPIKIPKKKTEKTKHRWYDKDTAQLIKDVVLRENKQLYYVMAFVYHICVRNKAELLKMKFSDIDTSLMRIRFRSDVTKNGKEEYREITPEFLDVLNKMEYKKYPKHYYIFGSAGKPNDKSCAVNLFSEHFKIIRDKLNIDSDFTIYAWKHTRAVHEIMKQTDPYKIMYLMRHSDLSTTMDYIRDFDINLKSVYSANELIF